MGKCIAKLEVRNEEWIRRKISSTTNCIFFFPISKRINVINI